LGGLKYGDCKVTVAQCRDVWRAFPQLKEIGLDQIGQECDVVLKEIP
jgi:hypothetical protein